MDIVEIVMPRPKATGLPGLSIECRALHVNRASTGFWVAVRKVRWGHLFLPSMRLTTTRINTSFSAGRLEAINRVMATKALSATRLAPSRR